VEYAKAVLFIFYVLKVFAVLSKMKE